jgi:hypothetical protein
MSQDAAAPHEGHGGHEPTQVEPDNPKVMIIVVATTLTILLVIAIALGINQLFTFTLRDEVTRTELAPVDARLKALRIEEKRKLTTYAWVNKAKGIARIPKDRAIDLTLRDWEARPGGTVAAPVAPVGATPQEGTPAPSSPTEKEKPPK